MTVLSILLGVALATVLVVLLTGVVGFARGGAFNRKYSLLLMNLRVASQALAVGLLGLIALVKAMGWG